jgi:hypothetical protein
MSGQSSSAAIPGPHINERPVGPVLEPYDCPAGGWGAVHDTIWIPREQRIAKTRSMALLSMDQPYGFDCSGCAVPEPKYTGALEFCENGAEAVAFELITLKVARGYFAPFAVSELTEHTVVPQPGQRAGPRTRQMALPRSPPATCDLALSPR